MSARAEVFQRTDGRWAFRIVAGNGQTVATDGGQGYENKTDADATAARLATGWDHDMKQTTTTMYGVARKDTVLQDQLFASYADAAHAYGRVADAMRNASLEPDVRLVQVEATTTYSRPKNAEAPEVDADPITVPTTGEGVMPDATGVWGGTDLPGDQPAPADGEGGIPSSEGEGGDTTLGAPTTDSTGGDATPTTTTVTTDS